MNGNGWFWLWYNYTDPYDQTNPPFYDLNDTYNFDDSDSETVDLINSFRNWNGYYQTIEQETECALLLNKNGTWSSQACLNKYYPFVCNYYLKVER